MRILLVSDLHYTLPQLDWVVRAAPQYDLVVIAGDSLDISSAVSLDVQSVVILKYLALLQAAGKVVVSSGNHDLTGPDAQGEQSALWLAEARAAGVPTDGGSLLVGDTLVTICPGWDGPLGRAAMEAQLARDAAQRLGLALFGRATNRHFICYSGFDRFDAQPEPARATAASATAATTD